MDSAVFVNSGFQLKVLFFSLNNQVSLQRFEQIISKKSLFCTNCFLFLLTIGPLLIHLHRIKELSKVLCYSLFFKYQKISEVGNQLMTCFQKKKEQKVYVISCFAAPPLQVGQNFLNII